MFMEHEHTYIKKRGCFFIISEVHLDKLVITPEKLRIPVKGSSQIDCKLTSSTKTNPTITWSFKDSNGQDKQLASNFAHSSQLSLQITDATTDQAGVYTCKSDGAGRTLTAEATVDVYAPSKFSKQK